MSDELGLVAGGEHGRWWSAPILDYHEGMMGLVEHIKKALTESEVAELDRLIQKFADGF